MDSAASVSSASLVKIVDRNAVMVLSLVLLKLPELISSLHDLHRRDVLLKRILLARHALQLCQWHVRS